MYKLPLTAAICAVVVSASVISAEATELITNGSFETYTSSGSSNQVVNATGNGDLLQDWTTTSNFTFLVTPALATASSSNPAFSQDLDGPYGALSFWMGTSPQLAASPDGGNFIAADGAYETGTLQQTVTGLTVGASYQLSYYQAAAQQSYFSGATTDQWEVTFGNQTQYATVMDDVSNGFSGWGQVAMSFTATSTSETLGFFAIGTPSGVPPFALLDGVSLVQVPEPATWGLLIAGLIGLAAARRWAQRRS